MRTAASRVCLALLLCGIIGTTSGHDTAISEPAHTNIALTPTSPTTSTAVSVASTTNESARTQLSLTPPTSRLLRFATSLLGTGDGSPPFWVEPMFHLILFSYFSFTLLYAVRLVACSVLPRFGVKVPPIACDDPFTDFFSPLLGISPAVYMPS
eukprot:c2869_g1_i1.p1 GENE.c2869_g1_i1~~c2869_g1_i1.p1  ORF type:complete len:154 (-),score=38.05 c2869_g1_i1:108-569(-)